MNQLIRIHIQPACWASLLPLQAITELQAELPVLESSFPLASYFTLGSVFIVFSQFFPPSLALLCPQVCSLCLHLKKIIIGKAHRKLHAKKHLQKFWWKPVSIQSARRPWTRIMIKVITALEKNVSVENLYILFNF